MNSEPVDGLKITAHSLVLALLPGRFAVCRLDSTASIPAGALEGPFASVTRTGEELSLVVPEDRAPEGARCELGWRGFKVEGPLDFALIGVFAALCVPLASSGIPLFALSTFDTDYLLVRETDLGAARTALLHAGHRVEDNI